MNLIGKILSSFITLAFAVVGGLWTAYTVLNSTMDSKVAHATTTMRIERTAQISSLETKIDAVKTDVDRANGKLDRLTDYLIKNP